MVALNEYVFDTTHKSGNSYEALTQITYSPVDWFHVGLTAQRTLAFQTALDVQCGFLVSVSHSKWEFTTYIYNLIVTDPSVVFEVGVNFECESARPDESWKSLPLLHFY